MSPEDIALFAKKQEFMYAVFERTLQTDQGKAFVRQHEQDFDAQKIYSSLQDYSVKSTKASLDTSKLLSYIMSAKMEMVAGREALMPSFYIGRTRSGCMKSRFQLGSNFWMP